jgi:capsular polysaccharide export protein
MMRPNDMQCLADSVSVNAPFFQSQQASFVNPALGKLMGVKNLLMLQGPVGPMFDRIANWKKQHGGKVMRILFNNGDALFCRNKPAIKYQGNLIDWPLYLRKFLQQHGFDAVILFGQSRKYHTCAVAVCRALGIHLFVMEEGYIRPGYMTLELNGVNGYSTTLRHYRVDTLTPIPANKPAPCSHHILRASFYAGIYYVAMAVGKRHYVSYQHHRDIRLLPHFMHWSRNVFVKFFKSPSDSRRIAALGKDAAYFFIPLQLEGDAQIANHSNFSDSTHFLQMVLRSFSIHAPASTYLVIKQHPLARGTLHAEQTVCEISERLAISARVIFVYEAHIPTLIKNSVGVVTINSTVGLQAIYQRKPLKVLGSAIYEKKRVTDSNSLNRFWRNPMQPDATEAALLYQDIKVLTQVPAAIYASRSTALGWQTQAMMPADSCRDVYAGA